MQRRQRAKGTYVAGRFIRGEVRFRAPKTFCLTRNYDEVVLLISKIFGVFRQDKTFVDFKPIETVSPDAALLLAAVFDMWQRLKNATLRTRDIHLWSPEVAHVFSSLGLFDLLKTPGHAKSPERETGNVQILKLCSGQGADGSLAHELTQALKLIVGDIEEHPLYVGLTEAMTNTGQHAYPDGTYADFPHQLKRWWMTGSYDKTLKSLRILILDLGVGIPATITLGKLKEQVVSYLTRFSAPDDADRITAAVEVGRTSTGTLGRGNGLADIRKFTEQSQKGKLRILSGKGEVVYTTGNVHPKKTTHAAPIPGTLIEWEIFR
jgi:hypothetical protein